SAKFHDWYTRTLESYARHFGAAPPADIWPPASRRFGRDLHFLRVNTWTHRVIPRPSRLAAELATRLRTPAARGWAQSGAARSSRRRWLTAATVALLATVSLVLVGCRAAQGPMPPLLALDLAGMAGT